MREPDIASLEIKFREALGLHQQGRLADAEQGYQAVLRRLPHHFDATYLLGVIALQTRRLELARELFGTAIALRPDFTEAYNNRGAALADLGHLEDALCDYDRAIILQPDHFGAHNNRGAALARLGRFAEALASYDRAIALQPASPDAYMNQGAALAKLGRASEALSRFDAAIALRPDHPLAFYNRGNVLRDLQRPAEAVESYDRAIKLRPTHAEAHNNRGAALRELGRSEEALSSHDRAIALSPGAEAYNNRGTALAELGRFDDALDSYAAALAVRPDHAIAHKNRAAALAALGRLDDALASCDRAIALRPDYAEAHADRAAALLCLGRVEDALRASDQAIALKPDAVEAQFSKGVCHLALGDFQPGWEGFEWRWKSRFGPPHPKLPGAHWRGETVVDGKTVLVVAEQGSGDSLQFCRYLPMLARRAKVILAMPRSLARLMARLPGIERVVSADDPLPPFDVWVPIMTLPMAFGTTLDTIPAAIPYLTADTERTAMWRGRLGDFPGRKIGLVWAGSPFSKLPRAQAMDRRRSITLADYAPLAALPGLCLVSLQKGEAGGQPRPHGMTLHDWTEELTDFADTAALIEALDLVISVDTSVVHLAGALGKKVWVLNRFDQCWRWLRDRTDSPWYPTARLFRQPAPGDWASVINDVAAALTAESG